jgi:hypothetical protein
LSIESSKEIDLFEVLTEHLLRAELGYTPCDQDS